MPTEDNHQNSLFKPSPGLARILEESVGNEENGQYLSASAANKIPGGASSEGNSLPPLPLVHSDLDEYGLDPYEFRIYAHIVRRTGGKLNGVCFAKLKKTAEICKMSVRKAQYALKTLCDAGLIRKEQRRGRTDVYRLTPKSNWKPKEELEEIRRKARESKADDDRELEQIPEKAE